MNPTNPSRAVAACTALALAGFAANSLLCRQALLVSEMTPAAFTAWRLASGALMLALLAFARHGASPLRSGSWRAALALFAYAIAFAHAYVELDAGIGALLLFGAVQLAMLIGARLRGERFEAGQWCGIALALFGLVAMKLPLGGAALPWSGTLAMLFAGVAWGLYSLLGRGSREPLRDTAGNFARAAPLAALFACFEPRAVIVEAALPPSWDGIGYALASGALASGLGYALWYAALPRLLASQAAVLQLLVPVIAAFGGIALLGESLDLRLALGGVAILGGVLLALVRRSPR
jgi:drug/metabolite transporter (DMT)-like permease